MKRRFLILALVVVVVATLIPVTGVSAKTKKQKLPKNGQKMYSLTFEEWCGKGDGYWEVTKDSSGKKQYRPYVLDDQGVRCVMPKGYYIVVDGYVYYTKKDGFISFSKKNPNGYTITKYGYFLIPEQDAEPEPTTKQDTKKKEIKAIEYSIPKYVIKDYSGTLRLVEVSTGCWITGWYQDRYFSDYGLQLGLSCIDGDWYYFSREIEDLGKMAKNEWVCLGDSYSMSSLMFFGKDGKALVNQEVEISGATYKFDSLGYLVTGWSDGHFYSSDPDRYGQRVQ